MPKLLHKHWTTELFYSDANAQSSPEVQLPYFLIFMLYCLRWFFAKEMETVFSSIT